MTSETVARPSGLDPHLIYRFDFALSLGMGLLLVVLAGPLTALVGWTLPVQFLVWLGAFLLAPWAAFNLWIGLVGRRAGFSIHANLAGDALWLVGTLLILVLQAGALTPIGMVLLVGQGLSVAAVLVAKIVGLGRLMS